MKENYCQECCFWQADHSKQDSIGWCWFNPPQILVRKIQGPDGSIRESIKTARPITGKQDFCGHWQPKEPK